MDNEFSKLTKEELLERRDKLNSRSILNAVLFGACLGISIYSAVKNGFTFAFFFPLILAYIVFNNGRKLKAIKKELEAREA